VSWLYGKRFIQRGGAEARRKAKHKIRGSEEGDYSPVIRWVLGTVLEFGLSVEDDRIRHADLKRISCPASASRRFPKLRPQSGPETGVSTCRRVRESYAPFRDYTDSQLAPHGLRRGL
jgi:hypothetical protein